MTGYEAAKAKYAALGVVEIQSQYLKKVQNYKGDDLKKYIEKIAKDELGYVGDGERIFINVAGE